MLGFRPVKSLQARLGLAAIGLTLTFALLAGGYSYWANYQESEEFQDDLLQQIAQLYGSDREAAFNDDNEAKIYLQRGPRGRLQLEEMPSPGFHWLRDEDGDSYRVFVRHYRGQPLLVMQENEYREELAEDSAWASAWPLLILAPLMAGLSLWIVRQQTRPLRRLAQQIEHRPADDLTPLALDQLPKEIAVLVRAINGQLLRVKLLLLQQKRFIGDASHEMRSPLTALSLQLERLEALPLNGEARDLLRPLRRNVQRNIHLLEQLLALARVQNEGERPQQPLDLPLILGQVIGDLLPLAEAKELDLGMLDDCRGRLWGNDTEIYLLIKTLTDNAIKYAPPGGRIDLAVREAGDRVLITVEDSGPGIAAEELPRVFEPFYRIIGNEESGSGLGLPIAKTITERHGGQLRLLPARSFASGLLVEISFKRYGG